MTSINADRVRIPREARDAIARHERVTVMNRDRPVAVLVHPDDTGEVPPRVRIRTLRDIAADLTLLPVPDAAFADDLEAVRRSVGDVPEDPWA